MKTNQQKNKWIIDACLLVGFLLSFYLELTGVIVHQWLGVVVSLLVFIHLLMHWDWLKAVTSRFFRGTTTRNRLYYIIDFLIVLGIVVILETGLMISTWFNLALFNYSAWAVIHVYSSITVVALVVLKIGLHWRWVAAATGKVLSLLKPQVLVPALVKIEQPEDRDAIDRRQFLATMGLVGLGSLLAVSNIFSDGNVALADAGGDPNTQRSVTETTVNMQPTETAVVEQAAETATQPAVITTEDGPDLASATAQPTQAQENTLALADNSDSYCAVRCNRRCSYPGHCRRYTDQNGNQLCDLGECV